MAENDEQTGAVSRRRRQEARAQGHAPFSRDLTAALGTLAAVLMLGAFGGDLCSAALTLLHDAITSAGNDPRAGRSVMTIAARLATVAAGVLTTMVLAHVLQTGGLWAPARLAPEASRLWAGAWSSDAAAKGLRRGAWSTVRTAMFLVVGAGFLAWRAESLARLSGLDGPALLKVSGTLIYQLGAMLAVAWVGLGVIDYALLARRFEAQLRMSPNEQREENRAIDGDPAIRSRRLQLARSWLHDPGEVLAGASLVLTGQGGLTVLLAGGPPPGPLTVRTIARGAGASTLRRGAERAGLPIVFDLDLARWFTHRGHNRRALPEGLAARLAEQWPRARNPRRQTPAVVDIPGRRI